MDYTSAKASISRSPGSDVACKRVHPSFLVCARTGVRDSLGTRDLGCSLQINILHQCQEMVRRSIVWKIFGYSYLLCRPEHFLLGFLVFTWVWVVSVSPCTSMFGLFCSFTHNIKNSLFQVPHPHLNGLQYLYLHDLLWG